MSVIRGSTRNFRVHSVQGKPSGSKGRARRSIIESAAACTTSTLCSADAGTSGAASQPTKLCEQHCGTDGLYELQLAGLFTMDRAGSPYGLKQSTHPRVRAEAGHVVVRLELSSVRDPSDRLDIEVVFPPEMAATLGFELLEASKKLQP